MNQLNNTRPLTAIVGASVFGCLAFLVMFLSFPIIPAFSFLKVDFSDVVLLMATLLYGYKAGIGAILVRTVLHYLFTGGDAGLPIGYVASLVASASFVLPTVSGILRWFPKRWWTAAFGLGTAGLTVMMSLANLVLFLPLYSALLHINLGPVDVLLVTGIIPFNIVKGVLVSIVSGWTVWLCRSLWHRQS